eukprot:GHVQ01018371.1.p1 GENE.GHVQ01018371.1~~GHVQ01018371.1.p1  ORF type:complete len:1168 (+),score=135.86 GHVQ01018371.1:2261-5764(+)
MESKMLVFCEMRVSVQLLAEFLRLRNVCNCEYVMGQRSRQARVNVHVGTHSLPNTKKILAQFKKTGPDAPRLLAATSVLAEGIDVPECNVVVMFDSAPNVVASIQTRGRARTTTSVYVIFTESLQVDQKQRAMATFAATLREVADDPSILGKGHPPRITSHPIPSEEFKSCYYVQRTESFLPCEMAKSLIYNLYKPMDLATGIVSHYSEKPLRRLQYDASTNIVSGYLPKLLHPDCTKPDVEVGQFHLQLLGNITKKTAEKLGYLHCIRLLHQAEILTDNLLLPYKPKSPPLSKTMTDQSGRIDEFWRKACNCFLPHHLHNYLSRSDDDESQGPPPPHEAVPGSSIWYLYHIYFSPPHSTSHVARHYLKYPEQSTPLNPVSHRQPTSHLQSCTEIRCALGLLLPSAFPAGCSQLGFPFPVYFYNDRTSTEHQPTFVHIREPSNASGMNKEIELSADTVKELTEFKRLTLKELLIQRLFESTPSDSIPLPAPCFLAVPLLNDGMPNFPEVIRITSALNSCEYDEEDGHAVEKGMVIRMLPEGFRNIQPVEKHNRYTVETVDECDGLGRSLHCYPFARNRICNFGPLAVDNSPQATPLLLSEKSFLWEIKNKWYKKCPIPGTFAEALACLHLILHKAEIYVGFQELQQLLILQVSTNLLSPSTVSCDKPESAAGTKTSFHLDFCLLSEALTSASALDLPTSQLPSGVPWAPVVASPARSYERLEFLGDAVLKYLAVACEYANSPTSDAEHLTVKSTRVQTNEFLRARFKYRNLYRYVYSRTYKRKFRLDRLRRQQLGAKTQADFVEALIGAAFLSNSPSPTAPHPRRSCAAVENEAANNSNWGGTENAPARAAEQESGFDKDGLETESDGVFELLATDSDGGKQGAAIAAMRKLRRGFHKVCFDPSGLRYTAAVADWLLGTEIRCSLESAGSRLAAAQKAKVNWKDDEACLRKMLGVNKMTNTDMERLWGMDFGNHKQLLSECRMHPSAVQRIRGNLSVQSYDSLEFVGDAALQIMVSYWLAANFVDYNEGQLTVLRSKLVCNNNLGHLILRRLHRHGWKPAQLLYFWESHDSEPTVASSTDEASGKTVQQALDNMGENLQQLLYSPQGDLPKFIADVYEALVGATLVLNDFDLQSVWESIRDDMESSIPDKLVAIEEMSITTPGIEAD